MIKTNTWKDVIDKTNELSLVFINCPENKNEFIYSTKTKDKWLFRCHCGKDFFTILHRLLNNDVKSCGCLQHKSKYSWNDLIEVCKRNNLILLNCPTINLNECVFDTHNFNRWQFRCECGNVFYISIKSIMSDNTTSCGCKHWIAKNTWRDIINACIELKLTFLHPISNLNAPIHTTRKSNVWRFKCKCGNIFSPSLGHILNGLQSCGCAKGGPSKYIWNDVLKACKKFNLVFENCPFNVNDKVEDVLNKKRWQFKCHCGRLFNPRINDVINENVKSCGCQKSLPQAEINSFINNLGFSTAFNDRKILYPFELDIYIPSLKLAIEYDGEYWHYSKWAIENGSLIRMAQKDKLCKEAQIHLLRIREIEWLANKDLCLNQITSIINSFHSSTNNII